MINRGDHQSVSYDEQVVMQNNSYLHSAVISHLSPNSSIILFSFLSRTMVSLYHLTEGEGSPYTMQDMTASSPRPPCTTPLSTVISGSSEVRGGLGGFVFCEFQFYHGDSQVSLAVIKSCESTQNNKQPQS